MDKTSSDIIDEMYIAHSLVVDSLTMNPPARDEFLESASKLEAFTANRNGMEMLEDLRNAYTILFIEDNFDVDLEFYKANEKRKNIEEERVLADEWHAVHSRFIE